MMLETIALAGFAAAAMLFLIFKFGNIRRVLAFDIWIDIGTTTMLSILLFGTFSGMATALIAGAMVSIVLYAMKKIIGYDKFTLRGWKTGPRPLDGVWQ
ncbi:MAG: hypothetical protein VW498_02105 [Candidatus Thalassarchaeaceae archaeon]